MEEVEPRITLSDLPDAIFQHILSFLDLEDIARLRVLCRRFQILSITSPSLSFSESYLYDHSNCSCTHVSNFMNTLLQHRPHALTIKKLYFDSTCSKWEHLESHSNWINKLFEAFHVDKLHLKYKLPSIFRSIPRFQSLKSLKLDMRISIKISVKLPCQTKLPTLESLFMAYFDTEDSIGEWISLSFPSLKKLKLFHITHKPRLSTERLELAIRSSSLEYLTIKFCCTFKPVRIITEKLRTFIYIGYFFSPRDIKVEISAPNLQNIRWKGPPPRFRYDTVTFKSLQAAMFDELGNFPDLFLSFELLEVVRHASRLYVNTWLIEDLYGRKPSISLGDNLRHLEILVGQEFCSTMGIEHDYGRVGDVLTSFLERIPNLESLIIVGKEMYDRQHAGWCWEALSKYENTKWKEIKGVKKVIIQITKMMYDPVPLLMAMIYSSCVDLEEMTLIYPSRFHQSMITYLNSFKSAFTCNVLLLSVQNISLRPVSRTQRLVQGLVKGLPIL